MDDLTRLKQEAWEKHGARIAVMSERDKRRSELLREAETRIDAIIDAEFGARLFAATSAANEKSRALIAEQDRLAKLGTGARFPLGTRFEQWDKWKGKTGRVGVYEIITADSQHPDNISSRAGIGESVIRILKKDGKPGKSYTKFPSSFPSYTSSFRLPWGWFPEGVHPDEYKKEARISVEVSAQMGS